MRSSWRGSEVAWAGPTGTSPACGTRSSRSTTCPWTNSSGDVRRSRCADGGRGPRPGMAPPAPGRQGNKPFGKGKTNIVERLINNMMRFELYTGKKSKAIKIVTQAFTIIEEQAKKNPVQVLVDALEKAAPREEITRLRFGGISVPRAGDIAPGRRLDVALRNLSNGAVLSTFKSGASKKTLEKERGFEPIAQFLAQEILAAARGDMARAAIAKKEEIERGAASAR